VMMEQLEVKEVSEWVSEARAGQVEPRVQWPACEPACPPAPSILGLNTLPPGENMRARPAILSRSLLPDTHPLAPSLPCEGGNLPLLYATLYALLPVDASCHLSCSYLAYQPSASSRRRTLTPPAHRKAHTISERSRRTQRDLPLPSVFPIGVRHFVATPASISSSITGPLRNPVPVKFPQIVC
jgi:hypothetical protein